MVVSSVCLLATSAKNGASSTCHSFHLPGSHFSLEPCQPRNWIFPFWAASLSCPFDFIFPLLFMMPRMILPFNFPRKVQRLGLSKPASESSGPPRPGFRWVYDCPYFFFFPQNSCIPLGLLTVHAGTQTPARDHRLILCCRHATALLVGIFFHPPLGVHLPTGLKSHCGFTPQFLLFPRFAPPSFRNCLHEAASHSNQNYLAGFDLCPGEAFFPCQRFFP